VVAVVALAAALLAPSGGDDTAPTAGRPSVVQAPGSVVVGGRTWRVVQGGWSVEQGELKVEAPGRLYSSLMVTDGGSPDVVVQARLQVAASGAGLVFRYQDPFNFWGLEAVQGVASWRLFKVVTGKKETVGDTGLSPTVTGTIVSVTTRSDGAIEVAFNGRLRKTFSDPALREKRGVGVLAFGPRASRAVFSDFTTLVPPG
jgi:hypothetical protein